MALVNFSSGVHVSKVFAQEARLLGWGNAIRVAMADNST